MQYACIDVYFLVPFECTSKGHRDEERGCFFVSRSCHLILVERAFPFTLSLPLPLLTRTISLVRHPVSPLCITRENDDRQLLFYAILCLLKRAVRCSP